MVSPGFYKRLSILSLIFILFLLTIIHRQNPKFTVKSSTEHEFKTEKKIDLILDEDKVVLDQIREMTRHAWKSYKKYAWGDDELLPLSKSGKNWTTFSYLFTPVDSLDSLFIMGLTEEYQECKKLVLSKLNFDIDPERYADKFNHFEITIRVLGGLLAAFELDPDKRFLTLAVDLGDRLIASFDNSSGIPAMWFNIGAGTSSSTSGLIATIGTIQLELQYLSDVTGNPVYQDKVSNC
jgi:hypothetical protein